MALVRTRASQARMVGNNPTGGLYVATTNQNALVCADGGNTAWTVNFWFNSPSNASGSAFATWFCEEQQDGEQAFNIQMNQSGQMIVNFRPIGFGNPACNGTSTTGYADGLWHWMMVVKYSSTDIRSYVDGTQFTMTFDTGGAVSTAFSSKNRVIAGSLGGNAPIAEAKIARVVTYKRGLQLAEAKAVMYGAAPKNPSVYWPMTGESVERDFSGNNFYGVPTSGTNPRQGPPVMFGASRNSIFPVQGLAGPAYVPYVNPYPQVLAQ